VRCIAHRGFAETYPENTVAAVNAAADHTDDIELDVRVCGSGDPVVVHDETVDRVTGASGAVSAFDADELANMNVLGSNEGIPRLRTVFEAAPDGLRFNLELKEVGLAADVLGIANEQGVSVMISSFSHEALQEARDVGEAPMALLTERGGEQAVEVALELECAAIHPHWQDCVDEFVSHAHDQGLSVNAWTVPSRHDAEALDYVGVDGIVVDRPDVCLG
jgi:glycerophosphoryl diester phosphodiesterase